MKLTPDDDFDFSQFKHQPFTSVSSHDLTKLTTEGVKDLD